MRSYYMKRTNMTNESNQKMRRITNRFLLKPSQLRERVEQPFVLSIPTNSLDELKKCSSQKEPRYTHGAISYTDDKVVFTILDFSKNCNSSFTNKYRQVVLIPGTNHASMLVWLVFSLRWVRVDLSYSVAWRVVSGARVSKPVKHIAVFVAVICSMRHVVLVVILLLHFFRDQSWVFIWFSSSEGRWMIPLFAVVSV